MTGHSLGGALSPLLALYLKERLNVAERDIGFTVEAWPYAGPTPGDQAFAEYLVGTLDAYHAFNNNYDVVPHVWELDSLDRLCSIYADQPTVCDSSLQGQTIVQAFAQWAIGQSKASGINYHIASQPNTFDGPPLTLDAGMCDTISYIPLLLPSLDSNLFKTLVTIAEQCGSNSQSVQASMENFFLYFLDVGYQHTVSYEWEFFPSDTVAAHVNLYVGQTSLTEDLPFLVPILGNLMDEVNEYISSNTITDCACPD